MAEYNKVNVKLSNSQLNALKPAVENQTWATLTMSMKERKQFISWIIIDNKAKS